MTTGEAAEIKSFLVKVAAGVLVAVVMATLVNVTTLLYWKGGLDEWRYGITRQVQVNAEAIREIMRERP